MTMMTVTVEQGSRAIASEARARSIAQTGGVRDIELVVLVLADGFRPDVLQALLASGYLPNLRRHILREGSYYDGVTVLPSVTDAAYLPMLTGQYPGSANMPGIRWVDKSRFAPDGLFLSGHRSYVGVSHLRFNGDLPDSLETLFELSPGSLAVRSDIHRGLPRGHNPFHATSIPFMFFSHYLKRADFIDRIVSGRLSRALRSMNGNLPRFAFLPLLDVDTRIPFIWPPTPSHHRRLPANRRDCRRDNRLPEAGRHLGQDPFPGLQRPRPHGDHRAPGPERTALGTGLQCLRAPQRIPA